MKERISDKASQKHFLKKSFLSRLILSLFLIKLNKFQVVIHF
jgi:hypothetical protein